MDELTREFLIESQEGLDRMERCLTELEERPQDAELIAEIFRAVHTIKGTTGFLGFSRLEHVAHSGENLLGLLREGMLTANQEIISALLALMDALRAILGSIEADGREGSGDDSVLISRLNALHTPLAPGEATPANPAPDAEELRPVRERKKVVGSATPRTINRRAKPNTPARTAAIRTTVPIAGAANASGAQHAEPAKIDGRIDDREQRAKSPAANKTAVAGATGSAAGGGTTNTAESTLRVDVTLLNRMMNLVGELVLTRNQILQATSADGEMTVLSRRLDMVTADLRESVMKARMQPVSHVFSKFPRMVRDLAQSLSRRVRLQMEGQETELDKSLLEAIKDPLTHAVRNAIDHGIEPPEARKAAGKEPEGLLRLRAYQEGSHVIIEVCDDGAGIYVDRIRQKAIDRNLITAEKAAQLNEREVLQLIFLPGFSTAQSVTNVSGRGVGMDVVRTNVTRIGGKVEIDSRPGKGTTLRLRIPLTLAIIPALIVRSHQQSFALPQGALFELVHLPADKVGSAIEWIEDAPLYRLRGKLMPLVFLERMLAQGDAAALGQRNLYIAVLDAEGRRFGLVVDGLADPEEIVVKPLSAVLKSIGLYSGATVLGNGGLALILDPGAIATRAHVGVSSEEMEEEASIQRIERGTDFLLVDTGRGQAALPVDEVLRIERIPLSRVEYIGETPVLNADGIVLPLEDTTGTLDMRGRDSNDAAGEMTVVVCKDGLRHVGIAVLQVLDVAAGSDLEEAGTGLRADGVTLLKERVTNVVRLSGVPLLQSPNAATAMDEESEANSEYRSEDSLPELLDSCEEELTGARP